ncbi:MAG: hypothetical protein K2I35_10675, partial [Duncaniella sp.]|nr:hypothetical protein [Duncaniella sp.]
TVEMVFDPKSLGTTDTVATISIILIYIMVCAAVVTAVMRSNGGGKKRPDIVENESAVEN